MKSFFIICLTLICISGKSICIEKVPNDLKDTGVTERLGDRINRSLMFTNSKGVEAPLDIYFSDKPILISFVYFGCPMLCQLHLDSLVSTLKQEGGPSPGAYKILTISMNHNDTQELAANFKEKYIN